MRYHRNPQDTVSNNLPRDNFNPGEALESLYAAIIEVEAVAHAAESAIDDTPCPSSPDERRLFGRLYALVSRTAAEASAALAHGEALVAALSDHLEARRARYDDVPRAPQVSP